MWHSYVTDKNLGVIFIGELSMHQHVRKLGNDLIITKLDFGFIITKLGNVFTITKLSNVFFLQKTVHESVIIMKITDTCGKLPQIYISN